MMYLVFPPADHLASYFRKIDLGFFNLQRWVVFLQGSTKRVLFNLFLSNVWFLLWGFEMFHGLLQEEAELCSWLEPQNLPRFRCWWANLRPYSMEYVKNRTKYRISCVLGMSEAYQSWVQRFFFENLSYNSIAVNLLLPCCMWGWGYKSLESEFTFFCPQAAHYSQAKLVIP